MLLPDWIVKKDTYEPLPDRSGFAVKTIRSLAEAMHRIQIQTDYGKQDRLPVLVKLTVTVVLILVLSMSRRMIVIGSIAALVLLVTALLPAEEMASILKTAVIAAMLSALLFLPAVLFNPQGAGNQVLLVLKVFLSVAMITIFNHRTQWNELTKALRKLHVPGLFIFTLDLTLKYIVLLGGVISDLLTALQLRSVGKNSTKYASVGGILGVTFLKGTECGKEMYEAMQCRGFTDDYKGL